MTNDKNKNSSSSPPAKRPKKCSNCPGAKVYTSNKAEYKSMVRRLTSTLPGSSGQTSLRVPTQAQVSNPQPIRLNDASIPPGSSGQTSLRVTTQARVSNPQPIRLNGASIPPGPSGQTGHRLPTQARVSNPRPIGLNDAIILPVSSGQTRLLFPTQAHVSNHRLIKLYDAPPNGYPVAQSSSASRPLPFPFPPVSMRPRTSAAETTTDQASSSRPSPPSPPLPPSVPTMLPTSPQAVWSPPPAPLVPAKFPEVPPSLPAVAPVPPSPPREQGEMERAAYMQSVENILMADDDDFNLDALMAPLPYVTGIINEEQHWENVPPQVLTNQPSGSLNVPDPQNGRTMPASEHGSNSLSENVAPQVHATSPSVSLPVPGFTYDGLEMENILPPVPAWSPSMNRLNGPNYQHMLPDGIAPPVHATLPSNSQNGLGSSNVPPPATFKYGCLQGGPHSQNIVPSDNIPPPVAPSGPNHQNDHQQLGNALPSESQLGWPNPHNGLQQGTVPENVPSGSSDLFNYSTTYEEKQRLLEQMGFGTVPSWDLD